MSLVLTPVILTFDEAPNIARVLECLRWAGTVVVVDSGSSDGTQALARSFDNVHLVERAFDDFQSQWNFALDQARAFSPWALALDADYILSEAFIGSLRALPESPPVDAYRASFIFCVHGRPLRGSLYPAKPVLFHLDRARYLQRGHTQVLQVDGTVGEISGVIFHDDRKSQRRWLRSQWRYAHEEAAMIDSTVWRELPWSARVRKMLIPAAPMAFTMTLLWRGVALDGWPGLYYALQRTLAELLITMALVQRRIDRSGERGQECDNRRT